MTAAGGHWRADLRADSGLADLLILCARWPDADPDLLAGLLALRRVPATQAPEALVAGDSFATRARPLPTSPGAGGRAAGVGEQPRAEPPQPVNPTAAVSGLPFYRVTAHRPLPAASAHGECPRWWLDAEPIPPDTSDTVLGIPPPAPLTPWRRLWPFLRAALGEVVEQRAPDLERLVRHSASARPPRRIPRRRRARWTPRARVILDFSLRHADQLGADVRGLIRPLLDLRGAFGLELLGYTDAAVGPWLCFDARGRPRRLAAVPAPPAAGVPVLIVGDLGCCGDAADQTAWLDLLARLRRAGVRPLVLSPCPPRCWQPELARDCRLLTWDRARRLPRVLPRASAPRAAWPQAPPPAADADAARLLDWLAPAVRIEPFLLRALRCRLGLDIGAELAAWRHPHLAPTSGARQWRDAAARAGHEAAFRRLAPADRALLGALLRERHHLLPETLRLEEEANLARLCGGSAPAAADHLARLARTLAAGSPNADALRTYLHGQSLRAAPEDWADERRAALFTLLHRERLRAGEPLELPDGLAAPVPWLLAGAEPRARALVQRGGELFLIGDAPVHDPIEPRGGTAEPLPGSVLAHLRLTDAPVQVLARRDGEADPGEPAPGPGAGARGPRWRSHPADARRPIPLPPGGLLLRGHDAELTIAPLTRPAWAGAIGQDGAGLFADVPHGGGSRRLRWVPPGPPLGIAADHSVRELAIPHGAFWDEDAWRCFRSGETLRADWAARRGIDDIGPWAEFDVKGVTQRMRWIWPAAFWMGSPAGEDGRESDETRHEVLLTRGYWLADTACTQALWRAVMDYHPSSFKGAERPVENVSWEGVQAFIEWLNRTVPGLGARLPTEAEWEHGCRAGTTGPFWFGAAVTTDQVNYNDDHLYGGAPKGKVRRETVPVKALPANAWGLYQMHGNVWEWCRDWYAAYDALLTLDPAGPDAGVRGICRGGSWFGQAVECRSAQRRRWRPVVRSGAVGFRLARGPIASQAQFAERDAAEPRQAPDNRRTVTAAQDAADAGRTQRERSRSGVGGVLHWLRGRRGK
jgi:formylglycine-generating enzyme required for sulfatase activity